MPFVVEELGIKDSEFTSFVTRSSYATSSREDLVKVKVGFIVKRLLDLGRMIFIS